MHLQIPQQLFRVPIGQNISKRNLYDLIRFSKVDTSPFWGGSDFLIGNTPQQGINWIGHPPAVKAVIIKTKIGAYSEDGWVDATMSEYRYSFKARNGEINFNERANRVLVNQPQYRYPVLLFSECKEGWKFEGNFSVVEIEDNHVVLSQAENPVTNETPSPDEAQFPEGGRRYVTHLMVERSAAAVNTVKFRRSWICEICSINFEVQYGVSYIEAHHKVPISTYSDRHPVSSEDFALLCPNCHKAVHIHMKKFDKPYEEIRRELSNSG